MTKAEIEQLVAAEVDSFAGLILRSIQEKEGAFVEAMKARDKARQDMGKAIEDGSHAAHTKAADALREAEAALGKVFNKNENHGDAVVAGIVHAVAERLGEAKPKRGGKK